MRATVSQLDAFNEWKNDEDADLPALLARLRGGPDVVTEAMLRGRAFAKCLQAAAIGAFDTLSADGYTFAFTGNFTIESWPRREESKEKNYDDLIVPARCDRVLGKIIVDDKTTEHFDAERYLDKYQWRFYLDIWNADKFQWYIWELKKMDEPKTYCVHTLHPLTAYRYARMGEDCHDLAREFKKFASATLGWKE